MSDTAATATAATAADIFANAHIAERSDLVSVNDPVLGPIRQQAPYPRVAGTTPEAPVGAPKLGQHTREVLSDLLGLSDTQLDDLSERGVV